MHFVRPVRMLSGFAGAIAWVIAPATPHIPPTDSTVLEHVPAMAATQKLAPLRTQITAHPEDLRTTLALAQGYMDIGRTLADPRFVSYSQATLRPWIAEPHPDPAALTLTATALQYLHDFDAALRLLDRALAIQTFNGQAWLTRATILQVQGHFEQARQACRPLARISGQLIALTCLTSINSMTGRLDASYHALNDVFSDDPRLDAGVRVWILNQLADMAQRLGDNAAAERYFQAALRANPQDGYTKGEYADLLLRNGRAAEVTSLLKGDEQRDNLLLRLAIAATRLRSTQARRLTEEFQSRYEAARRDGDTTHLREQARFLLEVRADARTAVQLAVRNWNVQREPADVRVYWDAATRAGSAQDVRRIREWIQQLHYQDALVEGEVAAP